MANENNTKKQETQAEEVVLGPMHVDAAAFKAAIKKAKKNPVDCGIFDDWYAAHPEEKEEEK